MFLLNWGYLYFSHVNIWKSLDLFPPRDVLVNEKGVKLEIHFAIEVKGVCESKGKGVDFALKIWSFVVQVGNIWSFIEVILKLIKFVVY